MPAAKANRIVWRIVRGGLLVYLGILLVLSALQAKLIFPGAITQGQPEAKVVERPGTTLARIDSAEGAIAVLFGEPTDFAKREASQVDSPATILFFYGNGMCLADAVGIFDDLRDRGHNVVLVDYPGYGMSGGSPSETGVYTAANVAYDFALKRMHVDPTKIVPVGWSLGSAAAVELATRERVAGLVLLSPFTSMNDMARRVMPLFPTSLILKHRFDNEGKIAQVDCPIFIAHGSSDSIIPCEMSDRLASTAARRVSVNLRLDCDHNDLFDVGGDDLIDQIDSFVRNATGDTGAR